MLFNLPGLRFTKKIKMKTYSELINLPTFKQRFDYLKIGGSIGEDTFGFDRWLNQYFYQQSEWRKIRDLVIVRDNGCDLGMDGFTIGKRNLIVHHMNPITKRDILDRNKDILDPEFLICVSRQTHQAIHYGNEDLLPAEPVERKANDTCPWKK